MSMKTIIEEVSARRRVCVRELRSGARLLRRECLARWEFMALAREERFTFTQIARFLNMDHSTVIYGVRRYKAGALPYPNPWPVEAVAA